MSSAEAPPSFDFVDNAPNSTYGEAVLYPDMVPGILALVASAHWTVQFATASHLADDAKMAALLQIAVHGGPADQIAAGRAAAATIADFTLAFHGNLMTPEQATLFLAGYALNSPANRIVIGSIIGGGSINVGFGTTLFPPARVVSAIDGAVNTGALTPLVAGKMLAIIAPQAYNLVYFNEPAMYRRRSLGEFRALLTPLLPSLSAPAVRIEPVAGIVGAGCHFDIARSSRPGRFWSTPTRAASIPRTTYQRRRHRAQFNACPGRRSRRSRSTPAWPMPSPTACWPGMSATP